MIKPARQVLENTLGLLGSRAVPGLTQHLLDPSVQRWVEPLDDIASLVHLAALDQREATKAVAHGPAQRLGAVNDEQAGDIRLQPALDQVGQQRLDHGGVFRRPQSHCQHVFVAGPVDADRRHQHIVADMQSIDLDHQQVEPRQVSCQPFLQLRRAQRYETPRHRGLRRGALGLAGQIALRQSYRARVLARRHTDQHLVECPARQKVRFLDRRPARKLQFGAAALPHPWPPDGCLAAVPADLTIDHAPSMALPISVALVALATKLFRVSRKHLLDRRSPSLQAQTVEAALELRKPFDHQRRQRQRMQRIRKAVFPVAGLGTRFLPATKAMPKEMLPVVDRPLIQYVVDEAREAGIEHFIFVTGRNKRIIEDHFDRQIELECALRKRKRQETIELLARELPLPGSISYTRQQKPLGLGHAVWCARELVGAEPFALLLPDVLIQHSPGCLAQMMHAAHQLSDPANVIAVEAVPRDRVHMYGAVGVGAGGGDLFPLTKMVEKPQPEDAPSNLIITGRYILQPEIFDVLAQQERGTGGEIQLTDAMIALNRSQPFYGLKFEGKAFDCGSKIGFLAVNVAYALARADLAPAVHQVLRDIIQSNPPQRERNPAESRSPSAAEEKSLKHMMPQRWPQPSNISRSSDGRKRRRKRAHFR